MSPADHEPPAAGPTEARVRLVNCFARPYDGAVAAARTCYASQGIVAPADVAGDGLPPERARRRQARRDALAADIYQAGHHTTFQHAHLQFTLENVSRQFVWSFLHAHPFYNSEQVSQRYVAVAPDAFYEPPLPAGLAEEYRAVVHEQMEAYHALDRQLRPLVSDEFFRIFPARRRRPERWESAIRRKSMEVARYVLPLATLTRLYHTISAITLLRYRRLARQFDAPGEQQAVVERMVEELVRFDPDSARLIEESLPLEETLEHRFYAAAAASGAPAGEADAAACAAEFDAALDGLTSRLVSRLPDNEALLAQAVREVLGLPRARLDDATAIALVLDPERNEYLSGALDLTSTSKLMRSLVHPRYAFRKRLSHTADSQDQRHRLTPASRPCLAAYLTRDPDVVTPGLVLADDGAAAAYRAIMTRTWERIDALRRRGLTDEQAAYLLPNAVALRFTESADLAGLRHKLEMRLCYNAQEEIWQASLDEARQIATAEPLIGRHLLPPCTLRLRAGVTPVCPEGKRYCGVRVWDLELDAYERLL